MINDSYHTRLCKKLPHIIINNMLGNKRCRGNIYKLRGEIREKRSSVHLLNFSWFIFHPLNFCLSFYSQIPSLSFLPLIPLYSRIHQLLLQNFSFTLSSHKSTRKLPATASCSFQSTVPLYPTKVYLLELECWLYLGIMVLKKSTRENLSTSQHVFLSYMQ